MYIYHNILQYIIMNKKSKRKNIRKSKHKKSTRCRKCNKYKGGVEDNEQAADDRSDYIGQTIG